MSWLTYAFRLMYLPIGLFGVSIATAVLPAVSRHAAVDDRAGDAATRVARASRMMLMLNVPATLGLVVLATPIVRLLFERGRFTPADTAATAAALRLLRARPRRLLGGADRVADLLRARAEPRAGRRQRRARSRSTSCSTSSLVRVMGFRGLALGTSIAALVNGARAARAAAAAAGRPRGRPPRRRRSRKIASRRSSMAAVVGGRRTLADGRAARSGHCWRRPFGSVAAIGAGLVVLAAAARLLRIRSSTRRPWRERPGAG